ncbi:hypothetical protein P3T76_007501 [Phytophthora citrophthora]|uniref:START domain-containing protein n=1 Tax=Phytophthora citrophthora TaxID=4793 RepID=A0AAD9GLM9_9STRA|nr:hypothetical protein P3T76_007501 [Phytophthora citrophthora]
MPKSRVISSPFPDVWVSEAERRQLIDLVDLYVDDYIQKYQDFVKVDKRGVNKKHWEHIKSKGNLHVYAERTKKQLNRRGATLENSLSTTQRLNTSAHSKDLAVLLSAGTIPGELEDLMFGVLTPTLDAMKVKSSFVYDFDTAAILCSVLEPRNIDPYRSLTIKWMSIEAPLKATKCRDFVFLEATGVLDFPNGDRIGYHFLHSIDLPQTQRLTDNIRGNLSLFSCFTQLRPNTIDNFSCATVDPGLDIARFVLVPVVARTLLAATNYVYCGQMKKLAWLLQHRRSVFGYREKKPHRKKCSVCKKNTSQFLGSIGSSTCRLCCSSVCFSCKIRQQVSFIAWGGRLIQRKITFCAACVSVATDLDAFEPATDQAKGYDANTGSTTYTFLDTSMSSLNG